MQKVRVFSNVGAPKWDGKILLLGRIPVVGEIVSFNGGSVVGTVVEVHHTDVTDVNQPTVGHIYIHVNLGEGIQK